MRSNCRREAREGRKERSARAQLLPLSPSFLHTHNVGGPIFFPHGHRDHERLQTESAAVEGQALEGVLPVERRRQEEGEKGTEEEGRSSSLD